MPLHPFLFSRVPLLTLQYVCIFGIWVLQRAHLFSFNMFLCLCLLGWFLLSHITICTFAPIYRSFLLLPGLSLQVLVHSENHSIIEKIQNAFSISIDFYPSWGLLNFLNVWVCDFYQFWKMCCQIGRAHV